MGEGGVNRKYLKPKYRMYKGGRVLPKGPLLVIRSRKD